MTTIHQNLQQFLLTDLGISLANIRAHLTWAAATPRPDGLIPFSPEDAVRVVATLERIEEKALLLAEGLQAEQSGPAGLMQALLSISHGTGR